jgi:hypothetical protein
VHVRRVSLVIADRWTCSCACFRTHFFIVLFATTLLGPIALKTHMCIIHDCGFLFRNLTTALTSLPHAICTRLLVHRLASNDTSERTRNCCAQLSSHGSGSEQGNLAIVLCTEFCSVCSLSASAYNPDGIHMQMFNFGVYINCAQVAQAGHVCFFCDYASCVGVRIVLAICEFVCATVCVACKRRNTV